MRSLEDIDEDEPAPIVIGLPANSIKSANTGSSNDTGSVMDDLFGPSTSAASPIVTSSNSNSSSNQPKTSNQQQPSQQSSSPGATSDALDDFFGPSNNPNNIHKNNVNKPTGTSALHGSSHINNSNANKAPDVFDSLFSSAPSATATSNNNKWFGGNSNNFGGPATVPGPSSSSSSTAASGTARSAIDQLDAFSAFSRGAAVPWKQNTSVADTQTKVLDIFGDGSGGDGGDDGRGVFIPPDQVLSLMTLYDVVGAAANWQVEDISKAYKKKAILLHPDKLPGGKRTEREDRYFKIITAAYDVLKDKDKRAEYDAALRHGGGSQGSWLNFVS